MRSEAEIRELRAILQDEGENTGSPDNASGRWMALAGAADALSWALQLKSALDDESVAYIVSKVERRKRAQRQ